MPVRRPTCLIGDPSEIDMPYWRPIINIYLAQGRSPIGLRSGSLVSDQACWSPMGLRSGMLFSDGSPIGLRWVADRSPMGLR